MPNNSSHGLDPPHTPGAYYAQDRELPARTPAPPAAVKPQRHLSHAREVTHVERSGLGLDHERDPGRRDRDAVDIAAASVRQRVAQPPAFHLERGERPLHLVLRAGADPAAAREA